MSDPNKHSIDYAQLAEMAMLPEDDCRKLNLDDVVNLFDQLAQVDVSQVNAYTGRIAVHERQDEVTSESCNIVEDYFKIPLVIDGE